MNFKKIEDLTQAHGIRVGDQAIVWSSLVGGKNCACVVTVDRITRDWMGLHFWADGVDYDRAKPVSPGDLAELERRERAMFEHSQNQSRRH